MNSKNIDKVYHHQNKNLLNLKFVNKSSFILNPLNIIQHYIKTMHKKIIKGQIEIILDHKNHKNLRPHYTQ